MALQLGTIIDGARDRNPYFHKSRAPDAVVARFLTTFQQRIISKTSELRQDEYAQTASIVLALGAENAPGTVGAGSAGGLPAQLDNGAPVQTELPAGSLVEFGANPTYLVQPSVVGLATQLTLSLTGAAWVVNAFAGKYAWITDGPGIDQYRRIISNTADELTISTGTDEQQWGTIPVAGLSKFAVVNSSPTITEEQGVITALPALGSQRGYLVRLDAAGVPFIDLAKPLIARFQAGVPLPPHENLIGGDVWFTRWTDVPGKLTIGGYVDRWSAGIDGYSCYVLNGQLYLVGDQRSWADVVSIDLKYVPIAPDFTSLADFFLLRDNARDLLTTRTALFMGQRVARFPDVPDGAVDLKSLTAEAAEAQDAFGASVTRTARRFTKSTRSVW